MLFIRLKTDGHAKGATIKMHAANDEKLCPVRTLDAYIRRYLSDGEDKIFDLNPQTISNILKSVIKDAGMDSAITARSFRSGGVTGEK